MQAMMTNMDFYVTPVLNIDGYMHSWKDNTVSAWVWWIFIKLPFWLKPQALEPQKSRIWENDSPIKAEAVKLQWATIQSVNKLIHGAQHEYQIISFSI